MILEKLQYLQFNLFLQVSQRVISDFFTIPAGVGVRLQACMC